VNPHRWLGLLAARDFRLLWTGESISSLGSSVSAVALPLVALTDLHASVLMISLLTAAAWLPWLLIGLPAGAWVDRLPRRRVMLVADLVSLAAYGSIPLAAALGWLSLAQLLVAALAGGTASVFFATAYRAFLPALLDQADLLEGNAKLQGSQQVANVAGPGLAGVIAQATGAVVGVLADAISFGLSAACLALIRRPEPARAQSRRRLWPEIGEGLAVLAGDPLLRANTIAGCLANFALTGYEALLVVFLVRVVGLHPGLAGGLMSVLGLGGVAGALMARRLAARVGTSRAVLYCKAGLALPGLLIPLASRGPGLALFVLGNFAISAGAVAGSVIWSGFLQSYPRQLLGRLSTSIQFFNYGAIPAGAAVAGLIASQLGVRPTLWIMLSGLLLSSLVLLLSPLRRLRDLPEPPGRELAEATAVSSG
jgi:predicted MFS family arabinose efflux permease